MKNKVFKQLAVLMFAVTLMLSCENGSHSATAPKDLSQSFELVKSKSEKVGEHLNTMDLYVPKGELDLEALKALCHKRKSEFTNGFFSYVVIFDNKKNAVFPKTPFTGFYGLDEKVLVHIKAYYQYNPVNGYSKLMTYEKNNFESMAVEHTIE
jgi:hypothetical protein